MQSEKRSGPPTTRPGPDDLIPLADLVRYIPPSRNGKRRHVSSVYRYTLRGVRGVRLATRQLPDGRYTTLAAWDRFVQALTDLPAQNSAPLHGVPHHRRPKRQHAVEAEIERVRASLRRKGSGNENTSDQD